MFHVTEKLAEFAFEELSAAEMVEARGHLAKCSECREQVEQFQTTQAMLRSSADVEPPRRIMFEFEKPRAASWMWRWLAPMAASAAVAFLVVSFTPRPAPQIVERVVQQPAPAAQPAAVAPEPVDYEKIQAWLASELKQRDAAQAKEFQRVRGQMDYLDAFQQAARRETMDAQRSIQILSASR